MVWWGVFEWTATLPQALEASPQASLNKSSINAQIAVRELLAEHCRDVEPYDFCITACVYCIAISNNVYERMPPEIPSSWKPPNVTPSMKLRQRAAASILRKALACHSKGQLIRTVLDQVLGARRMLQSAIHSGLYPSVAMRLTGVDVVFIGEELPHKRREICIEIPWYQSAVTKVSQLLQFLKKAQALPAAWSFVLPATCVDPYYHEPRPCSAMEVSLSQSVKSGNVRRVAKLEQLSKANLVEDHLQAQADSGDMLPEARTAYRSTTQLLVEVAADDGTARSLMWLGLRWGVNCMVYGAVPVALAAAGLKAWKARMTAEKLVCLVHSKTRAQTRAPKTAY